MRSAIVLLALASLSAQPAPPRAGRVAVPVSDAAPARGVTTVIGYLWTAESAPVTNATLRLRNVISGRVELSATSNENGEFMFSAIEGGTYLIEYVDGTGRVLAVGSIFTIAPGETIATFIRLGERRSTGGLFTMIGSGAVAAAASVGVTAVAPTGRPASPNR